MASIYRILARPDYEAARATGVFPGTAHDRRDGFIHFSAAHQVAETARKHYAGQTDLLLLEVSCEALEQLGGPELKWEVSRGGELFPHLYGTLPMAAVTLVEAFVP
jgi:uncharacterized protein (DUF952 family)